jgi:ABC-type multidrug transport system ATPase subunit
MNTKETGVRVKVPPVYRGPSNVLLQQEWSFPGSPSVIGLLGINGAGKSSFFLSLAGLLESRAAPTVSLDGQALQILSFLPQRPALPSWLLAEEVVESYGFTMEALMTRFPAFVLGELEGKRVAHLSEGQVKALALALSLMAGAQVTLLDEPLSALDLRRRRGFREYLSRWKEREGKEGVVILSTQSAQEIVDLCDAIVILHEGNRRFCGTLDMLPIKPRGGPGALRDAVEDELMSILSEDPLRLGPYCPSRLGP